MRLAQLLQFLAACAMALAALSAQARLVENAPLEKIQFVNVDCAQVWMAQAVDLHQENALIYGESVSGKTFQYFDKESNLHYNYFRSYQPNQGRYTQNDPIGLDGGWNRFGYVEGNPLSYSDPDGLRARTGPRSSGGNSSQRREANRAETTRQANYWQSRAERDAWVSNFTRNNSEWGSYGDGFGTVTGGGIAGHHPSVPNAVETWLDPNRRRSNDPFVPGLDGPPDFPGNTCPRK